MVNKLTKKETIQFLGIPEKNFNNYLKNSKEIKGVKKSGRWLFDKNNLTKWNNLRKQRTVKLTFKQYEKCFEFAIKMVYSGLAKHGIRGQRSEVQVADDVIMGILVELALKKFLKKRFSCKISLDMDVHTGRITPQDIVGVISRGRKREPKLNVGIKGSKAKNCALVLSQNEYKKADRKSDVYIFGRVELPTDHLFRILRGHSFFKKARKTLEIWKNKYPDDKKRKTIDKLPLPIEVWLCGFAYHKELKKVSKIPGQKFDGYRYAMMVPKLHNSDKEWKKLISKL